MSASRRLGQKWTDEELTVIVDMHLNHDLMDGHNHDAIAKCLGRYSPKTASHSDGPVNQKLAEVIGEVDHTRSRRHPGSRILDILEKYSRNHAALRRDATKAWKNILQEHTGAIPPEVQRLVN